MVTIDIDAIHVSVVQAFTIASSTASKEQLYLVRDNLLFVSYSCTNRQLLDESSTAFAALWCCSVITDKSHQA